MPANITSKRLRELLGTDERLIFIRGGWSRYYDSRRDTEPPQGGGAHNDDGIGWEWNNFRPHDGTYYVYTRSGYDYPLNLQRLGAEPGDESVGDVMVVQVATRPEGGQVVVGWFRRATAHAGWQERPFAQDEGCAFIAPVEQAVLLPEEERTTEVPKGVPGAMGQSQVRYASDTSGRLQLYDWMLDILQDIRDRESKRPRTAPSPAASPVESVDLGEQGRGLTASQRKAVEDFAMARAVEHFGELYDTVKDVHAHEPYDLLCSNRRSGRELRVEVKGTTGDACTILVTRGEVDSARAHPSAMFIASGLTWADKAAAVLNPRGWQKHVIDPWAPKDEELAPTVFEWRNPGCKKGRNGLAR